MHPMIILMRVLDLIIDSFIVVVSPHETTHKHLNFAVY